MAHDHEHDHEHGEEHEHDESFGIALGFRIFTYEGQLHLAEVEVTPYVDEPNALGATLVFHPLDGLDPTVGNDELEWPAFPIDIDDDLTRDTELPIAAQFQAILRQLSGLSEAQLSEYLTQAMEEDEDEDEE